MGYHHIKRNEAGVYYVREKNFGYQPDLPDDESSSHWTWHITQRGLDYLCRDVLGRTQPLPRAITYEQLLYMKDLNMLVRSDGTHIGSDRRKKPKLEKVRKDAKTGKIIRDVPIKRVSRPVPKPKPSINPPPLPKTISKKTKTLWQLIKSLFNKKK